VQDPAFYASGLDAVAEELRSSKVRSRVNDLAIRFWDAGAELKRLQTETWDLLKAATDAGSPRAKRMLEEMRRNDVT
jgi:hypothetical protein